MNYLQLSRILLFPNYGLLVKNAAFAMILYMDEMFGSLYTCWGRT